MMEEIFCWVYELIREELDGKGRRGVLVGLLELLEKLQGISVMQENILLNYY